MGRKYYVGDLDQGSGAGLTSARQADRRTIEEYKDRIETRTATLRHDSQLEATSLPNRTRRGLDSERISPRPGEIQEGPEARNLHHQPLEEKRRPLSGRRKRREASRRVQANERRSVWERRILARFATNPDFLEDVNASLSEAAGDISTFPKSKQAIVRRMDRAIRKGEETNDHTRIVYANVDLRNLPSPGMPSERDHIRPWEEQGTTIFIDRYTLGCLQLHEALAAISPADREHIITVAVRTKRGAYLGADERKDDTSTVLPRALRLRSVEMGQVLSVDKQDNEERANVVLFEETTVDPADVEYRYQKPHPR